MAANKTTRKAGHAYNRQEEKRLKPKMIEEELRVAAQIESDLCLIHEDISCIDGSFWGEDICFDSPLPHGMATGQDDAHDDGFDYLFLGIIHSFIEDTWQPDDIYNIDDRGTGYLRWIMESVRPDNICAMEMSWIQQKHIVISSLIKSERLSSGFLNSEDVSLLKRYVIALENAIEKSGMDLEFFDKITIGNWEAPSAIE